MRHKFKLLPALVGLCLLAALAVPARAASFTDVPASHWASTFVERACADGAVSGVGGGRYGAENPVTQAEFVTILINAFYPDNQALFTAQTDPWYAPFMTAAEDLGLTEGVTAQVTAPLTRYQMARITLNVMKDSGAALLESPEETLSKIPDGGQVPAAYREAVANTYAYGLLSGMDGGWFRGGNHMTRAQAAVVYCHLADFLAGLPVGGETPEDPGTGAPAATEKTLTVGGTDYALGMSGERLSALAGSPDEILGSFVGCTWQVYGSDDYKDFFLAALSEGKVVGLCSAGKGFTYLGHSAGESIARTGHSAGDILESSYGLTPAGDSAQLFFDKNDGYALHMVWLEDPAFAGSASVTAQGLEDESRLIFHLTNAFRAWHGKAVLSWSDRAAASARLHSADMAAKDYFSHTALDGRSPFDRMREQGISFRGAGENIACWGGTSLTNWANGAKTGYAGGISAYAGWVTSEGHRENILTDYYAYLGVGGACRYGSDRLNYLYFTQNFYV